MNGNANGIIKRCDNVCNGVVRSSTSIEDPGPMIPLNDGHEYSLDSSDTDDDGDDDDLDSDFDDYNEISCRNLISSTPKNKQATEYGSSSGLIIQPV